MKKIFFITIIIIYSLSINYAQKYEKLIVGKWQLSNVQLDNIEEYAQSILEMQQSSLDGQISQTKDHLSVLQNEINTLKNPKAIEAKLKELTDLRIQLGELDSQRNEYSIEKVIIEFEKQFDKMEEEFKIIFYKNQTFENPVDATKGTYEISNDKKYLVTNTDGKSDKIEIKLLEKEKMILFIDQAQSEQSIKMTLTFKKQK